MTSAIDLTVNGRRERLDVPPDMPLVWALREALGLLGTKLSCGAGVCGACTVHVDGKAMRSCLIATGDVTGRTITTIEGLSASGLHPVQRAWIDQAVAQCGFCQSGFIMAAASLLAETPRPSPAEVDAALTNICRCGTYVRVRKAVMAASGQGEKANG